MERLAVVILFLSILLSANLSAKTIVVSDLDDTIKITYTFDPVRIGYNGVFTKKAFAGMSELFRNYRNYTDEMWVLTASPRVLTGRIHALLRKHMIEINGLFTRNFFKDPDKFKFKYNRIETLILKNPEAKFILIGDNSTDDQLIYQKLREDYPANIIDIYMHRIREGHIPRGQKVWLSAFDIAAYEYQAGRMSLGEVDSIYQAVSSRRLKRIVPKHFYCPQDFTLWKKLMSDKDLKQYTSELFPKIVKHCTASLNEAE